MKMKYMNVALMIFINNGGDVLLNKRRNSKDEEIWDLVGGGIEEGESPEEAIVREIKEELSYDISVHPMKNMGTYSVETNKYRADVTFFALNAPKIEDFTSSEEVSTENLVFMSPKTALAKKLLPMTQLMFDKQLLYKVQQK